MSRIKSKQLTAIFLLLISAVLVLAFLFLHLTHENEVGRSCSNTPCTHNGKRWRIGYYEGGPWVDYQGNLKGIVHGLMKLGWIETAALPELSDNKDTSRLWNWLCHDVQSQYIRFLPDAYWSSAWEEDLRKKKRTAVLDRLANRKDIDLIIAAGTWAGQDLSNDDHKITTIVISTSNPIQSGIIKSAEDSGFDHVFAKIDPDRYIRQLRLFHTLIPFKRLGIVYEDTAEGRSYAALKDARIVAREKEFEVITCKTDFSNLSIEEAKAGTLQCVELLAPQIDAFYFTDHRGQTIAHIKDLLKPLLTHHVATWAQSGSKFVKEGALFSTTNADYDEYGLFYANVITGFFSGKKLKDFSQIFEDPKNLAVNISTAHTIGYKVPPSISHNADIYAAASDREGAE